MNKKTFFTRAASKALALAATVMMSAAFTACSSSNDNPTPTPPPDPTPDPKPTMEYVDLGLPSGLKWARCNLGASKPSDYGDYFAWGETEPNKAEYTWATYKWGTKNNFTKYNDTDGKIVLDPEDDAATVNLGSPWRMPTADEIKELLDNCTWTWTTQDGVNGCEVKSKKNGNSIFLPSAGNRMGSELGNAGSEGYYRSSSLNTTYSYSAHILHFNSGVREWAINSRFFGGSVRPVRP